MHLAAGFFIGFIGMEAFSWAFHKYAMHGPLWFIHKSHHRPNANFFEANDVFSLLFGTAATVAVISGLTNGNGILAGTGFGVTAYGMAYFILHDIAIHGRLKNSSLQRMKLIARIRRAHKIHHKFLQPTPGKSFGLFYVRNSVFDK
jgi:beta-carotene 3-hydroxylase